MWVEIDTLKTGDNVVVRHQGMVVEVAEKRGENGVTLKGETWDGRKVIYVGLAGELVELTAGVE